jgi:hypothetical protein
MKSSVLIRMTLGYCMHIYEQIEPVQLQHEKNVQYSCSMRRMSLGHESVTYIKAIMGSSTQQFFSSSDVIATTYCGHTTIMKWHTVAYCVKLVYVALLPDGFVRLTDL